MKAMRLEDYQVSATHGFLPSEHPLQRLPEYYEAWESICSNLCTLLRIEKQLAIEVGELPILSTKNLAREPEWRRAYVLLGFIANAYIWGSREPLGTLPANIAVPFINVSEHLEIPPVATYAAQNLWNYRPRDQSRSIEDPENYCALTTFTDSVDESWFFAIPAAIEARGAPIIPLTLKIIYAASSGRPEQVISCLQDVCGHIEALTSLLSRMYERCNPNYFFHKIRPFLAGTTSVELPRGVLYERENGTGSHWILQGPTAAQSSLFHFLDISLGVRHRPTGNLRNVDGPECPTAGKEEEFLRRMRQHMPGGHRRFLEDVSKVANIRQYVTSHPLNVALQEAYNACLEKLVAYRNKHVQIVSRYIVVPSRAGTQSASHQTEPGTAGRIPAVDGAPAKKAALGTGGTAPVESLKQVRNETKESIL